MSEKVEDLDVRFERFYAANYPRVKNYAKLLNKKEEDAEDIAQNIFLKLWTRPELWQEQETMTSYLYTVTRNKCLNHLKHEQLDIPIFSGHDEFYNGFEATIIEQETFLIVRKAVEV